MLGGRCDGYWSFDIVGAANPNDGADRSIDAARAHGRERTVGAGVRRIGDDVHIDLDLLQRLLSFSGRLSLSFRRLLGQRRRKRFRQLFSERRHVGDIDLQLFELRQRRKRRRHDQRHCDHWRERACSERLRGL